MTEAPFSVLVRAKLSPSEWAEFRKLAIDKGQPVSQLAAEAMRALLPAPTKGSRSK